MCAVYLPNFLINLFRQLALESQVPQLMFSLQAALTVVPEDQVEHVELQLEKTLIERVSCFHSPGFCECFHSVLELLLLLNRFCHIASRCC